jgi:hypothetical protein
MFEPKTGSPNLNRPVWFFASGFFGFGRFFFSAHPYVLDCFSYLIILSATSITITNYYNHQHITYITSAFEKIEEDQLRLVESNKKEQILEQYYIYSFAIKKN